MSDALKRLLRLEYDVDALMRRVQVLESAPPQWPGAVRCPLCSCMFQGDGVAIGCRRLDCPLNPKVKETGARPLDSAIEEALQHVGE